MPVAQHQAKGKTIPQSNLDTIHSEITTALKLSAMVTDALDALKAGALDVGDLQTADSVDAILRVARLAREATDEGIVLIEAAQERETSH